MRAHWPELVGGALGGAVVTLIFLTLWLRTPGSGTDGPWPVGFRT